MLSLDSLIAAAALSAAVTQRHYARLALMFGACDLAASSVAPLLSAHLSASSLAPVLDARFLELLSLAPGLLLSAVLVLCRSASRARQQSLSAAAYVLPPLFAFDNLFFPSTSPVLAGLFSCAMAAAGFVLGAATLDRWASPAARPLWAAGLAVGAVALQLAA
jgi:hypothetical protein